MRTRFAVTLASAMLTLGAFAAVYQAASVVWKPAVGASHTYKLHSVIHNIPGPSGTADLKIDAKMVVTTKEIRPDGNIVVEDKQSDFSVMMGNVDLASLGAAPPKEVTETAVQKPNGDVVSFTSDAPKEMQSPRLEAITQFIYPDKAVNAGDTWTRTLKGDGGKGTFDTTTTFTYQGTETIGGVAAYKVLVDYKETNAPTNVTATGTIYFAQTDGELVKGDLNVKNADLGQGIPPTDAEMHIERA